MRIQVIKRTENDWLYFWIKTIESINISQHCAKTFNGKYLNGNDITTPSKDVYVCGVSKPYNYKKNVHIALKQEIGNIEVIKENGIEIKITDAKRIKIKPLIKGEVLQLNSHKKEFYTCRNWQYANQLLTNYEQRR